MSSGRNFAASPLSVVEDERVVAEFQLDFRLGEGTYGTVWAATHLRTKKKFAVKTIQRSDVDAMERQIVQEAVIMQGLRHKHVVRFHKLLKTKEMLYFVMDLAEGELFDLIIQSKNFSETTARKYFQQLISALVYCRKQGVAHRDLKAENLLLDKQGNLLVCDFGFSLKVLPVPHEYEEHDEEEISFNCLPLGTLHYVSPEAAEIGENNRALDPFEQDLWAAGVILYFMLRGSLPFDGRDEDETLFLIRQCTPDFGSLPVTEEARDFVRHLLVKDPMDRLGMQDILQHKWFCKDLDASLFPEDDESLTPVTETSSSCGIGNSVRANEGLLARRHSSRAFLDFVHLPQESVSPTEEEEDVIRRAFKAIGTNGFEDRFTFDELRDALIVLKKCAVDSDEVNSLIEVMTGSTNNMEVTFHQFRSSWIEHDLAHAPHQDSQFFQLFKLASLSHPECEPDIVRLLRNAFNSVDDTHTGIISFVQWKHIFEKANICVSDYELHCLLHYWNEVIPDGSISFEDFVTGIVKRDIFLKHPLGRKLASATNLAGFAELRNVNQSARNGFLVLGARESIADKLTAHCELLHIIDQSKRVIPDEIILTFLFRREGCHNHQSCAHSSPLNPGVPEFASPSLARRRQSTGRVLVAPSAPWGSTSCSVANPPISPQLAAISPCSICGCQLDIILAPTACMGYTLVKIRRIAGITADFHESVLYISSVLEHEREQAMFDSCISGASELM